jgi:hypothetical protein
MMGRRRVKGGAVMLGWRVLRLGLWVLSVLVERRTGGGVERPLLGLWGLLVTFCCCWSLHDVAPFYAEVTGSRR